MRQIISILANGKTHAPEGIKKIEDGSGGIKLCGRKGQDLGALEKQKLRERERERDR